MKFFTKLNIVFGIQLVAVICAVLNIVPREIFLFSGAIIIFYIIFSELEDCLYLIARSIPLFVALPITESFDSLNIWRLVVIILFTRVLFSKQSINIISEAYKNIREKLKSGVIETCGYIYRSWALEFLLTLLLIVSTLSLLKADDLIIGVKRIIYFINLWMLFFIVKALVNKDNFLKLAHNVFLSGIIVVVAGGIQLLLAYTMYVDDFSNFWALQVDRVLYGDAWAHIAIVANTWFAYYSGTIHLRMFSSFPDTHSFPLYLLMVMSFVTTIFFVKRNTSRFHYVFLLWLFLAALESVLSGTRGIWASILFPILFIGYLIYRRIGDMKMIKIASLPLLFFIISIPLSSFIFNSTQFLVSENENAGVVLKERLKSIIDFEETSNQGRVEIWKASIKSSFLNPVLGVGIGNFPSVLQLDPEAIKAGASAHNIYLNFLAETGLFSLLIFMLIIYEMGKRAWNLYIHENDLVIKFFTLNWLIYFIWILWYSMTDVALFDERPFLLFMIFSGIVYAFNTLYEKSTTRIN